MLATATHFRTLSRELAVKAMCTLMTCQQTAVLSSILDLQYPVIPLLYLIASITNILRHT